jgi:hypothetical protein
LLRYARKKRELGKAVATIKTVVARLDRAIQYPPAGDYWVTRSSRVTTVLAM